MANDSTSDDALRTGLLLVGGGVAGYFGGRWFTERWRESEPSAPPSTAPARAASPASSPPAGSPPRPTRPPTSPPEPVSSAGHVDAVPAPAPTSGPVTSPDQVPATSQPAAPRGGLSRRYDRVFDRHRGDDLPIDYLRALAHAESNMNPRARARTGARGLFQITRSVRLAFNKANGTSYEPAQLDDPETNTAIACWLLRFITTSYAKHHPAVPNMRSDWRNPRYVELVTFGYNAGFSEQGGVGSVVGYLEARGARDIDVELVHAHARAANAVRFLSEPKRLAYAKRVAVLYFRERSLAQPSATPVA